MKIYTINKHWRVVETVEVMAETEEEALEKSKLENSGNVEYIEVMDSCVTETKDMQKSLDDLIDEATEYLESTLEDVEFDDSIDASYEDFDHEPHYVSVSGAYFEQYEIMCYYCEEDGATTSRALSDFTEADQYRICEQILNHKNNQ